MSNSFKSNSRFASLVEDLKEPIKEQKVKEEKEPEFSCFRPLDENEKERRRLKREAKFNSQKEFEEKEKEKIKQQGLIINTNNFPELVVNSNLYNDINKCESYIEKLKHKDISVNDVDPDLVDLKQGWVLLKKDIFTGKTIMKKHTKNIIANIAIEEEKEEENGHTDLLIDILINLHEKRRQEYIDNYGYEEWERMFKFPNWREEEAYLEMMEQEQYDETSEEESELEYEYE